MSAISAPTNTKRSNEMRLLPASYVIGPNDVICGRGSRCFNHVGNQRFRLLVEANMDKYFNAVQSKLDKTAVIDEIIHNIRSNCAGTEGGFIKEDLETGRFYEVGDFLAVSRYLFEEKMFVYNSSSLL